MKKGFSALFLVLLLPSLASAGDVFNKCVAELREASRDFDKEYQVSRFARLYGEIEAKITAGDRAASAKSDQALELLSKQDSLLSDDQTNEKGAISKQRIREWSKRQAMMDAVVDRLDQAERIGRRFWGGEIPAVVFRDKATGKLFSLEASTEKIGEFMLNVDYLMKEQASPGQITNLTLAKLGVGLHVLESHKEFPSMDFSSSLSVYLYMTKLGRECKQALRSDKNLVIEANNFRLTSTYAGSRKALKLKNLGASDPDAEGYYHF